jgi:mono/diheme cytochrome c family protein
LARAVLIGMTLGTNPFLSRLAALLIVAILVLAAGNGAAADATGEHDYRELCASCHGASGTGAGATLTEASPPDLTQLSVKNGGKFPFAEVYRSIDGGGMKGLHKRFAMPFWGEYLQQQSGKSGAESQAEIKQRIVGIVRYLETIQRK